MNAAPMPAGHGGQVEGYFINSRKKRNVQSPVSTEETTLRNAKVSSVTMDRGQTDLGGKSTRTDSTNQKNQPSFETSDEKVTSLRSNHDQTKNLLEEEEEEAAPIGRRVARSELRWNGEDRRSAGSRQEELKVTSSTFALTGDSSHNQAMVHWSGHNSSPDGSLTTGQDFPQNSAGLWERSDT
ncbi:unnamed protein product [Boreogadus saida]